VTTQIRTTIGFHCPHEQHAPSALLRLAQQAHAAGFAHAMCSDHFHPWGEAQGQSGFTWSWLGAAMQATPLSFGTVCAPGQRYHPAIVAQAAATLAEMYPGRFWISLGSGEALNESITGDPWPPKPRRQQRMEECAAIMRALWAGETVTHRGTVTVHNAKLYSRPAAPPMIVGAALTPATARRAGGWADALITIPGARDRMREVLDAFREGGGEGKPMFLQVALSIAATDAESERIVLEQWPQAALTSDMLADIPTPQEFDQAVRKVDRETVLASSRAWADPQRHVAMLQEDAAMGFERIYLHNLSRDHRIFFDRLAPHVLEALAA
jgi:probable non-F420 flavinoid oxidoreductase